MRAIVSGIIISIFIFNAFSQKNMQLRSVKSYQEKLNDIWGYHDPAGKEYAIAGVFNGVSIVDVSNPDNITEVQFIPGAGSIWRDIKTWNHYAYVTNETSGGLLIIDLSGLPNSVNTASWIADSMLNTAHNLHIDENGFAYIFGFNNVAGAIPNNERGALIANLNVNPMAPIVAGIYNAGYVHDGFVRGDTLWTSEFSNGYFAVVDVEDKSNPVILATQETPSRKTHNCWLSNDGKTLFTTDETSSAFITSYDVSELDNITELDRYQAAPNSGVVPHNSHVLNDFLITSYYKYGVNIVDVSNPDNLVEVGYYDTSPFPSSPGFQGCWGAYPFLPSGNILATDIETGLYVLTPTYVRGCYLEGMITEQESGAAINDTEIEIMTTTSFSRSNLFGRYKNGTVDPGNYDIRFIKSGCIPKIVPGINLQRNNTATLNTTMVCTTFISSLSGHSAPVGSFLVGAPSVFHSTTDIIYRIGTSPNTDARLDIFNISGQRLHSIILSHPEGAVEFGTNAPKGIYIAVLRDQGRSTALKLVKN